MFTLTAQHEPASDLGYLLHKHPDRYQCLELNFGRAHVFYPELSQQHLRFALLLDIDSIALVKRQSSFVDQYVNDRPFVCSSFFSVALAKVLGSALNGRSQLRPELVEQALPLEFELGVIKGSADLARSLFEALDYSFECDLHSYETGLFSGQESPYFSLYLKTYKPLALALRQLYVLLPVLDVQKHYYFSQQEVDKLLEKGAGWLESHPQQALIARRYLSRGPGLVQQALQRLSSEQPEAPPDDNTASPSLNQQRIQAVLEQLGELQSVVDLGCGEGRVLKALLEQTRIPHLLGVDIATQALAKAERRLQLERLPEIQRARIQLLQSSILYRDRRLHGTEGALLIEVIEHLEPHHLERMARVVWGELQPRRLIVTTPNREYNACYELGAQMRHHDHRFEWSREEFQHWCQTQAEQYAYGVRFHAIGPVHVEWGAPTQMAVFERPGHAH